MKWIGFLFALGLLSFVSCNSASEPSVPSGEKKTYFTNPIRANGADPWVIRLDGKYYFSECDGHSKVFLHEFDKISEMPYSQGRLVYDFSTDYPRGNALWGPHINKVNGEWYIYFCAQTEPSIGTWRQRMWVLRSTTDSPYGPYENCGEVLDSDDTAWAIDGSILQRTDGSLFFVWAGMSQEDIRHGVVRTMTYMAHMKDPMRIDRSTITIISAPTEPWETSVKPIQEGQRPLYVDRGGKTIIMFSANASWTDEYCLGSLTNEDGNYLNPASWRKSKQPLFQKTALVFGPGAGSYVKSLDGKEDWIIYHAARYPGSGWDRDIRAQRFRFDTKDNPIFDEPIAPGIKMEVPSGEGKRSGQIFRSPTKTEL